MAVVDQVPVTQYVGNGVTTAFPVGFDVETVDQLVITINNIIATSGTFTYTGGTVSFAMPPTGDILITRKTAFSRSTDYSAFSGYLRPDVLNLDFDRIWRAVQELGYSDTVLNAKIVKEIADRFSGDINEANIRLAADNVLQANINSEANTRSNADNVLQANINSTTATLQGNINAEATTRLTNDNLLQANINAEASNRASGDTSLQANINSQINTEITNRSTADAFAIRIPNTEPAANVLPAAGLRAGKFLSFDSAGQPILSSGGGGGGDSGLRADLLATNGALLVSTPTGTVQARLDANTTAIAGNTAAISTGTTVAALTLTALNTITTKPVNSLGYVTNDSTNNGMYQWNGTVWTKSPYDPLTQANTYTDTKVVSVIAPKIVSKNLVIAANVQVGKTLNTSGALLTSASFSTTDYIPVSALTAYSKTASSGAWCEYDASKNFILYTNLTATVKTSATTAFIRASIFTGATFDVQQGGILGDADTYATKSLVINQYADRATTETAITAFSGKLNTTIQVSARQLDFLTRVSPNLFDSNRYYPSKTLSVATVNSILYATPISNASYFMSDVMPVTASTAYKISGYTVWVQYDASMNVVAYNNTALYVASTITMNASTAFFQYSVANNQSTPVTAMFTLLSEYPTVYIPYRRYILPNEITSDSAWRAKTILWLGTSIPAGGGYPENVTANLLATLNKQSISGGRVRAKKSDGSWFVQSDLLFQFTLSKADVNARYGGNLGLNVLSNDYLTLNGAGVVLTQAMLDALTASNYEVRLTPNIAASNLFILDYGINDRNGQLPTIDAVFKTCEQLLAAGDLYNRNECLGAMNFLIKTIQDAKAAANDKNYRIVIINHHTRGNFQSSAGNVVTAQENLAKYWGFPLLNMADNMGLNDLNIASLTNSGDGLHFSPGSNLEKRYTRYITAKLKDLDT